METAGREIFLGIENGWIVYILAALALLLLGAAVARRFRLWRSGRRDDTFENLGAKTRSFIRIATVEGLLHRKVLSEPYPGVMHGLLFWGALLLLLASLLDVISHYALPFLTGNTYLAISFLAELGGAMMLVGVGMAAYRRYVVKPRRLDSIPADAFSLGLIFVILVTGFVLEGARMAATDAPSEWARWSFLGFGFYGAFADADIVGWYQGLWWFHSALIVGTIGYMAVAFSKLTHLFVSPLNVFFKSGARGILGPIDLGPPAKPGYDAIRDFPVSDLMDLDACTRCGRCQDACPAYIAGKPLNPKKVIQDIKLRMQNTDQRSARGGTSMDDTVLVGEDVGTEELWECTTCLACQEACPVHVRHLDKIVGLRRSLVENGRVFRSLAKCLESLVLLGNPWSEPRSQRCDWTHNLKVNTSGGGGAHAPALLYWVGCSGAYDPKAQEISRAMVSILNASAVDYAVLGTEEMCCGDPARRAGEEGLFRHLAGKNIETLQYYGVKKIVANCPHCYNVLRNEYPALGGDFEVVHHSEFILELLSEDAFKARAVSQRVAFHDPCYLARYNGIVEPPRAVLRASGVNTIVELENSREHTFCCGGGGAQMWIEGVPGRRVNRVRFEEVSETGVEVLATACPFCRTMLEDASSTAKSGVCEVSIRDIAEIV